MTLDLAQAFLSVLSQYATAIILVLIVFVMLGAVRGWVTGIGSAWGMVAIAALFVLLGIFGIWAGQALLGVILILVAVLVLVIDAYAERRGSRGSRSVRR